MDKATFGEGSESKECLLGLVEEVAVIREANKIKCENEDIKIDKQRGG